MKRIIRPPTFKGLDLTDDARVTNPGAAKDLYNLYMREPGVMAVRPGSEVVATAIVAPARVADGSLIASGLNNNEWGFTWVASKSFASDLGGLRSNYPPQSVMRGTHSIYPFANTSFLGLDTTFPTTTANTSAAATNYINGLSRIYVPQKGKSYWIGSAHRNLPNTDLLWWLNETSGQMRAIPVDAGTLHGTADDWHFLPISSRLSNSSIQTGIFAFATNGVGRPVGIFLYNATDADPFEVKPAEIRANVNSSSSQVGDIRTYSLANVRSMCRYGGTVAFGGFGFYKDSTDDYKDFSHCVTFLNIDGADGTLARSTIGSVESFELTVNAASGSTADLLFHVKVGDDPSEPVLAVCPISYVTDEDGVDGALACFTAKKVVIYKNPPPVSGNGNGTELRRVALDDVGCASPKSVVRTPDGVVFLGTDGLFYLIGLDNSIRKISRAIGPMFQRMSPRWYRKVQAYWDGERYKVFFPVRPNAFKKNIPKGTSADNIPTPPHNTLHMYADMRRLTYAPDRDMGVQWEGPHDGLNISAVCVARDIEDWGFVMAGCSHTPALVQLDRYDLRTDPAMNDLASSTRRFPWRFVSGEFDLQDMHEDKSVHAIRAGIRTTEDITVHMGFAAYGDVNNKSTGFETTVSVVAPGTIAVGDGVTTGVPTDGSEPYQSDSVMSLPVVMAPERIRGRVFQLQIQETTPTTDARPAISDVEFEVDEHYQRRSTS